MISKIYINIHNSSIDSAAHAYFYFCAKKELNVLLKKKGMFYKLQY